MRKNNTIDQLRMLNELFVYTGASIPDRAEHVRRVLNFLTEEHEPPIDLSLREGADRLAQLHFGSEQSGNLLFAHWDVTDDEQFSPLWIRYALVTRMQQIVGYHAAFLLITGLREAICPKGCYWTRKRQDYYERICSYINEFVHAWSAQGSCLHLALL